MKNSHKISYSAANFSVNLMSQAFATYIVFYYVDVLGVAPLLISQAMFIHGIFNAFMNPILGHVSDRTHTKWGRRLPYMTAGILPLGVIFALIWSPWVSGGALFWYFLWPVLMYDIFFVLVVLNWTSLFPEMFTSLTERASVSAWRQMFGLAGMILGVAVPPLLYGTIRWANMGILFATLITFGFAISIWGAKQEPSSASKVDETPLQFVQAL